MVDDAPIEVGKLQDRFLSDERGRRIYFPPFGLARLVPSRDAEAKLRERTFFIGLAGIVPLVGAQAVDVYWPDRALLYVVLLGFSALLLDFAILSGGVFARHWTQIAESDCSYEQCVMGMYARRSSLLLLVAALVRGVWLVALVAAPALVAHAVLTLDAGAKGYRLIPALLLVPVLLPSAWLGARRAIRGLLIRLRA